MKTLTFGKLYNAICNPKKRVIWQNTGLTNDAYKGFYELTVDDPITAFIGNSTSPNTVVSSIYITIEDV